MGQHPTKNIIKTGANKQQTVQSIKRSLRRGSTNDRAYSDYVNDTQDFAYIEVHRTILAFISWKGDFIEYLWVSKKNRRKGYAKKLFDFYKNKHSTFSFYVTSKSKSFWERMVEINRETHRVQRVTEAIGEKMIWTRKLIL